MRKYTFKRWIPHLLAFNKTAINLKAWKFKYLFHDIDKPFLNLFRSNDYVKKYHRYNSKHHVEYKNIDKQDFEAMVIDWECSVITKPDKPLNAVDTYNNYYIHKLNKDQIKGIEEALTKLKLI